MEMDLTLEGITMTEMISLPIRCMFCEGNRMVGDGGAQGYMRMLTWRCDGKNGVTHAMHFTWNMLTGASTKKYTAQKPDGTTKNLTAKDFLK